MADWYVSSTAYAAVPVFVPSVAYTVGQFIRATGSPVDTARYVFRCTTAGTAGAEPGWPSGDGSTATTGGATFTNVTSRSTYAWAAPAGTLRSICNDGSNRGSIGDRFFLSSDHVEAIGGATYAFGSSFAYGLMQFLSVSRFGSVPPGAGDLQAGATIRSTADITINPLCSYFWQGINFTLATGGSGALYIGGNPNGTKLSYFKNCAISFSGAGTTRFAGNYGNKWIFDNCTINFSNTGTGLFNALGQSSQEMIWINTSAAIQGTPVPTQLLRSNNQNSLLTCRGVDLSALTTSLNTWGAQNTKILLDSCKIAPGMQRLNLASIPSNSTPYDVVELVNCWDGSNTINERWTEAGSMTQDRTIYLSAGVADDTGQYSCKLASISVVDPYVVTTDSFVFDVENPTVGTPLRASVELVSTASLTNADVALILEYMGAANSTLASFVSTQPSSLSTPVALPSSSNTWTGPSSTVWSQSDLTAITLSSGNLVATSTGQGFVRGQAGFRSGKYYWECTATNAANINTGYGIASPAFVMVGGAGISNPATVGAAGINVNSGSFYVSGVYQTINIGAISNGNLLCFAIDLTANLFWIRLGASGNWNASGTANPATGAGGVSISGMATAPIFPLFFPFSTGEICTANFGASAFTGAVPSGFTAGWPGLPTSKQLLQAVITPQRAGRVRGMVRLCKQSTTCWINPQVTLTPLAAGQRLLSSSRAGLGSVVATTSTGQPILSNVGAVNG